MSSTVDDGISKDWEGVVSETCEADTEEPCTRNTAWALMYGSGVNPGFIMGVCGDHLRLELERALPDFCTYITIEWARQSKVV